MLLDIDERIKFEYAWAMPSKWTFRIKPIRRWMGQWITDGKGWADPFCGSSKWAEFRGDITKGCDAKTFFQGHQDESLEGVLFDPPYSLEALKRCYDQMGIDGWQESNKSGSFSTVRDEISRCIKPGGHCLSFGWSSAGIGKTRGFTKTSLLLVCHGGRRYDTICLAERKI